jgi:TANFOR domain-containing protein
MSSHFNNSKSFPIRNFRLKTSMIFLFGIMIISYCQAQQYSVTITIAVSPPYPPKVNEYIAQPNKIMATLLNTGTHIQQVYVQGSITGEGGIKVYTDPNYKMPQPLILQPGMPFLMSQGNIQQVFSSDHLIYHGITKNEILYGTGLPEGNYTICLQAFDYQTNQQVSQPSPLGCSNTLNVTSIEPPVILQPVCGETVTPNQPQNLIFSWTRPPGAPVNTQFNLKIIEVLPMDRNINDAMQSASHPVFFETNVPATVYIFGPADPQLVTGKKYAFAVTASDPSGEAVFRNNGMSEVCWFKEGTGVQPINEVSCDCKCIPVIYWGLKQGNTWSFEAGGVYSCSGYCPVGQEAFVCENKDTTYLWSVDAGMDVVSITGKKDSKKVELKINNKGAFSLTLKTTLKCTCNSCEGSTTLVETVTTMPPPTTGCLCEIQSEITGGAPINVVNPLAAYVKPMIRPDGKPSKSQTLAVGLSVLANDKDDLIHRCILGKPWEKLIENVGDPVSYSWTIEKGTGVKILGEKQGTAMLILPYDIKPKDVFDYRIKCIISSNADEDLTGYVNVKVSGADTCDYITVTADVEKMSPGTKKTPELKKKGDCEPQEKPTWMKADDIVANLKIPAFVPVGELTLIGLDAFDSDRLTMFCKSLRDGCGNPEKTIELFEGLVFEWSDGGAGGTFVPVTNGNGALYRAPEKAGEVTISCKINDAGNHSTASGEKTEVYGKIKVVDVMRALFMGEDKDTSKRQFLTVGRYTILRPFFTKQLVPELLKSDWCLDLGGKNGMMKASVIMTKTALKPGDLTLRIQEAKIPEAKPKDHDLFVYWRNHQHIHGKHPLICKTTYRFPKNEIPYIDGDWQKNNFLEEKEPGIFKLFFSLYDGDLTAITYDEKFPNQLKPDKVGKLDDGRWRGGGKNDDDFYGNENMLNDDKNVANWILHWAKETYKPSKFICDLKNNDPKLIYRSTFSSADGKYYPIGEYRWEKSVMDKIEMPANILLVSDKAMLHSFREAHTYKTGIGSDMKKIPADVTLPKIDIIGIESAIRCINHELAHWEAVTAKWKVGVGWQKLYGNHTFFQPWQQVNDELTVDLKKIKSNDEHKYFDFIVQNLNDVTIAYPEPVKNEVGILIYDLTITFPRVKNDKTGKMEDSVKLTLPGAWFVYDGAKKRTGLKANDIIYSNVKGVILNRVKKNKKERKIDEYSSSNGEILNGVFIVLEGANIVRVFERHNDPDGDWIPNAVEDEMGTDWLKSGTHKGDYHKIPNDQEFWAEWHIRDLFNADGKLKADVCTKEKDWANPGLQTIVEPEMEKEKKK